MRYRWPADTAFTQNVLTVEQEDCDLCHRALNICDHRFHRIFTLQGPMEIVCKLARCPDPDCPAHAHTQSPLAEGQITLPWWLIGWDVFCWMGFRRFTRHWSIPQLQAELHDHFRIRLSDDAISGYKDAEPPKQEQEAKRRRKIMRRARSKKLRGALLAELEQRYLSAP